MKYALQVAVVAMTLFSISAALSLWLNQQKTETAATADKTEKKEKKASSDPDHSTDKKDKEKDSGTKPTPKTEPSYSSPAAATANQDTRVAQLDRRQAMIELMQQDLQVQLKSIDGLVKQVVLETKTVAAKAGEIDAKAAELDKKKVELDANESKNVERIAGMVDGMPPETAAQVLTQMVDSGKMDTVVKVLALMKPTKAARVMAELEHALAGQLLDRMRGYKPAPVVPASGAGRTP